MPLDSKSQSTLMAMAAPRAPSPLQSSMDVRTNFGQGRGGSMFSTMPLMGHALSGTQLGEPPQQMFAEGGPVKTGPSAKERSEIRSLIEQGKQDAVSSLRDARAMLLGGKEFAPTDPDSQLESIRSRLRKTDDADDDALGEYRELMEAMEAPDVDPEFQMQMLDRASELAADLDARGVAIPG